MAMGKRFCCLCCVVIISLAYNKFTAIKLRGTNSNVLHAADLEFYSANCELKSSRKRWLNNKLHGHSSKKSWFINPRGVIQSLILLMCVAWCITIGGIAFAVLSLYYCGVSHKFPVKDLISIMRLFAILCEQGIFIFTPTECKFGINLSHNIYSESCSTEHYVHVHDISTTRAALDNILAVILMLLLMSGDIELNPGPRDHNTASSNQDDPHHDHDSTEKPDSESSMMPDLEQENLCPQAGNKQQPNNVRMPKKLPSSDQFVRDTQVKSSVAGDRFIGNPNKQARGASVVSPADLNSTQSPGMDEISDSSIHDIADQRRIKLIHAGHDDESNIEHGLLKPFEKQEDMNQSNHSAQPEEQAEVDSYVVYTLNAHHLKTATHEGQEQEPEQQDSTLFLLEASVPLQEATDFFEVEHCYPEPSQLSEFAASLNKELDSERSKYRDSFAKCELDDCTVRFFCCANRLHRAGCPCNYCSLCGEYKKDNPCDSHIFPKGLLKVFRRIHCYNLTADTISAIKSGYEESIPKERKEFIYDFVLDERLGTSAWTYELLCASCELKCSVAEEKLRSVYIHMMKSVELRPLRLLNENVWFHYVLAMIMFRGLLVSEKLCFMDTQFKTRFAELWNFCKSDPNSIAPDLRLFLLPNRAINENLREFLYSFEYSLRCPLFTRYVSSVKGGKFLYWKFDCFHVIYTVDDTSKRYFNNFQNILLVDEQPENCDKCLTLRWTRMRSIVTHTAATAVRLEYNCDLAPQLFPPALLEENIALNNELVKKIYDQASVADFEFKLLPSCKVMTNRYRGLGHKYPLLDSDVLSSDTYPTIPVTFDDEINFSGEKDDDYIEEASSLSPLRFPEEITELKYKNAILDTIQGTKHDDAKEIVKLKQQLSETKKKQKEDESKYKDKQKKCGKKVETLKKSLDKALKDGEKKARQAEEAKTEAKKLYAENLELKERIRSCNEIHAYAMMLKELRLIDKQQKEMKCEENSNLRNARKVLNMCMEVIQQYHGFNLSSVLMGLCQGYTKTDEESLNFANLEYLDLSFPARGRCRASIVEVHRTISC